MLSRMRLSGFYYYYDESSNTHKLTSNYDFTDKAELIVSSFCPTHSFTSTDSILVNGTSYFPVKYDGSEVTSGYFFTVSRDQDNSTNFKGYVEFTLDVKNRLIMFNKMTTDKMNSIIFRNTESNSVHIDDQNFNKLIDFEFISYDSSDNATALGIFDMTIHNNTVSSFLEFKIYNNDKELYYYPKISFMNTDSEIGFHFLIPFNIEKGGTNTISIHVKTSIPEAIFDISSNDISCILKGINIFKVE